MEFYWPSADGICAAHDCYRAAGSKPRGLLTLKYYVNFFGNSARRLETLTWSGVARRRPEMNAAPVLRSNPIILLQDGHL